MRIFLKNLKGKKYFGENIKRRVLERWKSGIEIDCKKISNIRFVEDMENMASNEAKILRKIEKESEHPCLDIDRLEFLIKSNARVL